jgi:hypothetical protein
LAAAAPSPSNQQGVMTVPWKPTKPAQENKHTMRARQLDAKAAKAARRGDISRAVKLEDKADKKAAKGGWF